MKKLSIILFLFVLFISFVSAVPPVTNNYFFDSGLAINYPLIGEHKISENLTLVFHVYNISNGVIIKNDTTICTFNLYDRNGEHLYRVDDVASHLNHFDVEIDGINFTEIGTYPYELHCNHTTQNLGGYVAVQLHVTSTGLVGGNKTMFIVLLAAIFCAIIILMIVADKLEFFYFTDKKGDQIPIMKYLVWLVAGWLCLPMINVAVRLEYIETLGLANTLTTVHSTIVYIMLFVSMMWIIGMLFQVFKYFSEENIDEGGAEEFESSKWWK